MVVINSPDGIKAFTELNAGTGTPFFLGISARSIRGIPKNEVNRIWITMSDKENAQTLKDAGITANLRSPQAPAVAKKAQMSLIGPGKYHTSSEIKIHGCPPGCLR